MLDYQRVNGGQWSFHVLSTSVMVFPAGLNLGFQVAEELRKKFRRYLAQGPLADQPLAWKRKASWCFMMGFHYRV
jgi:hypothetical protein